MDITFEARAYLKTVVSDDHRHVRLEMRVGGCAGYEPSYTLLGDLDIQEDDICIPFSDESTLVLSKKTFDLLENSTLDYVGEQFTKMLKIVSPNLERECGCGKSIG